MAQRTTSQGGFAYRKLVVLVAATLATPAFSLERPAPLIRPITFERNDGQYGADVIFVGRGANGLLRVRPGEIAIARRAPGASGSDAARVRFLGANLAPEIEAGRPLINSICHLKT